MEETGIDDIRGFEEIGFFHEPDRDPRGRYISCAFKGYVFGDSPDVEYGSDATNAKWFALGDLPPLAFDHLDIIFKVKPIHSIAWLQELDTWLHDYSNGAASLPETIPAGVRESIGRNLTMFLINLHRSGVRLTLEESDVARFSYKYQEVSRE